MKKYIQNIIAIVLLVILFCNNLIIAKADYLSERIVSNNEIIHILNNYFDTRKNAFYSTDITRNRILAEYSNLSAENEVLAIEARRNAGIEAFIKDCDIEIINVTTTYSMGECEDISIYQNSKYLSSTKYVVYEWTWIEYTADGNSVENMGIGTEHEITIAFNGTNYVIVSDEYDESDISGICTRNIVYIEDTENSATFAYENDIELTSLFNSERELDINAFIEYADAWVYHSPVSTGASYPAYYNPAYYYYTGNDCVNYASQCLHAAGMAFDTSGTAVWYADVTTNTTPMVGSGVNSTPTWRSIGSFEPYWVEEQGYEETAFSIADLTPGCVVINGSKNHVMVCVGYNSAGKPILNGHTNDRYHMIASGFSGAAYVIRFTYKSPVSYITLSSSVTQNSGYISSTGNSNYYKFVPASTGFYDIYTESAIDTIGNIYKEDIIVMSGTSYGIMNKTGEDDDGNNGSDFWLRPYLTAGTTYYIEVSANSAGAYVLHIE